MLWNALGGGMEIVRPEAHRVDLVAGDIVLLCTDGLTAHVSDERIAEIVGQAGSAEAACRHLLQAANEGGGSDNVTVVVVRCLEGA